MNIRKFLTPWLACAMLASAASLAHAEELEAKATLADLFGAEGAAAHASILPADHEFRFRIYTPDNVGPDERLGVMVFVSPSPSGEIPEEYKSVFDAHRMIWIAVSRSGNKLPALRRIVETLASATYAQREYNIDRDSIYLAGFSGGGRISSYVSMFYPDVFSGTLFICGVNSFEEEPNAMLDEMKKNRFVFLTGAEDFNRRETSLRYNEYKKAGFEHIKLMVVPGMAHAMPGAGKFEDALAFLEGGAGAQD